MFELLISSLNEKEQFLNTWLLLEPTGTTSRARFNHTLTNIGDKLYLHDGSSRLGDLWEYDIEGNVWTELQPTGTKPSGRYGHTLVSVGDKLYLYGGSATNNNGSDELWECTIDN